VNQKFEKDSTINATSIYELSENEQNRMEIFQEFLEIFELNLINYKTLNIENLFANALLGYSQTEVFSINNEIIEGTIVNCDEFGRLSVLINGEIKQFNHGEIKQII
jgi:biotin-(acetyl-CoA carboxylase) ligase